MQLYAGKTITGRTQQIESPEVKACLVFEERQSDVTWEEVPEDEMTEDRSGTIKQVFGDSGIIWECILLTYMYALQWLKQKKKKGHGEKMEAKIVYKNASTASVGEHQISL